VTDAADLPGIPNRETAPFIVDINNRQRK